MSNLPGLSGERSDHKVAGIFQNQEAAKLAATSLESSMAIGADRIEFLNAETAESGRALEPESHGIWKTMVRSHVWLALVGAVVGVIVFAFMWVGGVHFVVANPYWSLGLLIVFPAVGGAMVGGLITLRPDHAPYLLQTREAIKAGRHVLAVQAKSPAEMQQIDELLRERGAKTVSSL